MAKPPESDVERVRQYAATRVPDDLHDQIRMEVDVRGGTVTIVECRPPWPAGRDAPWTRQGVARMKFDAGSGQWTLYWVDSNDRWHVFDLVEPGPIGDLLEIVELDPTCIFWG